MWWRIFFWFNSFSQATLLLTLPLAWSKYSPGDWINLVINILLCVSLYLFAYQKKLLLRIYWKIFFWVALGEFVLYTLYQYTPFSFLDFLLKPKHFIEDMSVYSFPEPVSRVLTLISAVFIVLLMYALYQISYGKTIKKEKAKKPMKLATNAQYSKMAVTSLVTGIIGFFLGPLFTIIAFVTGIVSIRKIEEAKGTLRGRNLAWAGIICSLAQMIIIIFVVFLLYLIIRPGLLDGYQQAVKHMNSSEVTYYNNTLKRINSTTTSQQLIKIMGRPEKITSTSSSTSYVFECPKRIDAPCPITIDVKHNKVTSIVWWNFKRFFFYRHFDQ